MCKFSSGVILNSLDNLKFLALINGVFILTVVESTPYL